LGPRSSAREKQRIYAGIRLLDFVQFKLHINKNSFSSHAHLLQCVYVKDYVTTTRGTHRSPD